MLSVDDRTAPSQESASKSLHKLWSGHRQLLCANGPPFAIAIGEDICEQSLALAVVSRFNHGAIHNSCFTINPYMQIFETLLWTFPTRRMLAQKPEVLVLCDNCPGTTCRKSEARISSRATGSSSTCSHRFSRASNSCFDFSANFDSRLTWHERSAKRSSAYPITRSHDLIVKAV